MVISVFLKIIGFVSSDLPVFCHCCMPGLCLGYQKLMMHGNSFIVSRLSQSA